jgi:hypothetical protein
MNPERYSSLESTSPVDERLATGDHFALNAQEMAARGEFRKAAEMLWGGVTQYLKALAAAEGTEIRNHSKFFEFVQQFATATSEQYLYTEFVDLNALHKHFYDETIPEVAFPIYNKRALDYMRRIHEILDRWFEASGEH